MLEMFASATSLRTNISGGTGLAGVATFLLGA